MSVTHWLFIDSPDMFRPKIDGLIMDHPPSSFLLGNLGSWFVSVGMAYCDMKSFVVFGRACSRLIESCVSTTKSFKPRNDSLDRLQDFP